MELLGGLLVLMVIAILGFTVCAGGLCSEKRTERTPRGER